MSVVLVRFEGSAQSCLNQCALLPHVCACDAGKHCMVECTGPWDPARMLFGVLAAGLHATCCAGRHRFSPSARTCTA